MLGGDATTKRRSELRSEQRLALAIEPPKVDKAGQNRRLSLTTALVGFTAGTVFWHFVGFWDFVGRAVFKDPQTDVRVSARPAPSGDTKWDGKIETRLTSATQPPPPLPGCVALVLDRQSNATALESCPADTAPLQIGNFIRRGDLARAAEAPVPGATDAQVPARGDRKEWSAWLTTVIEPTQR